MKPRQVIRPQDAAEYFDRAVEERAIAALTLQDGAGWSTFKSRFLERDPRGRFFVLDYTPVDDQAPPEISPGQYVGVSFRQKSRKLLFATIVEAKGHYILPDQTTIPAVRYRWPDGLTELQRRAYNRTPVPSDCTLLVSLWAGGVRTRQTAQSTPLQIVTGELADLSCGGALVRVHQSNPPTWVDGQTLGAEIQLPDSRTPLLTDVRFRGIRADQRGGLGAAVQFVGLEVTPQGNQTLRRLADSVHRLGRFSHTPQVRTSQFGPDERP